LPHSPHIAKIVIFLRSQSVEQKQGQAIQAKAMRLPCVARCPVVATQPTEHQLEKPYLELALSIFPFLQAPRGYVSTIADF
jgi:hypothetical protein